MRGGGRGGRGKFAKPPSVVHGLSTGKLPSSSSLPPPNLGSHANLANSSTSMMIDSTSNNINDPLSLFPQMLNPPEPKDPVTPLEIRRAEIRQEMINFFQSSPFYLTIPEGLGRTCTRTGDESRKCTLLYNNVIDGDCNDAINRSGSGIGGLKIERYSDKYYIKEKNRKIQSINAIQTNLDFFPQELHGVYDVEKAAKYQQKHQRNLMEKRQWHQHQNDQQLMEKLKFFEGKEEEKGEIENNKDEDQEEQDEDEINEEEMEMENYEEETDYNFSYFDNGEDYGDDDDGGGDDEGPVY